RMSRGGCRMAFFRCHWINGMMAKTWSAFCSRRAISFRRSDMTDVFIIAEAGVNHPGSLDMALQLIDAASDAGATAVKFQTFKSEAVISLAAPKADYQKAQTGTSESQLD